MSDETLGPAAAMPPHEYQAWLEAGSPQDWRQWRLWTEKRSRPQGEIHVTVGAPSVSSASTVHAVGTAEAPHE